MARASNIPSELHTHIVNRWRAGASPGAIALWLNETNEGRAVQVQTSRSSVQRLLRTLCESEELGSRIQAIQRARINAPWALDTLEDIDDAFRATIEECSVTGAVVDTKAINARAQTLSKWNVNVHRDLKLACITGVAADKLLEKHAGYVAQCSADVRAQDAREAAGLPPEGVPVSIPLVPEPIVDSNRAPSQRVPARIDTSSVPGVPVSIPFVPEPIVDSNRAVSQVAAPLVPARFDSSSTTRVPVSLSYVSKPIDDSFRAPRSTRTSWEGLAAAPYAASADAMAVCISNPRVVSVTRRPSQEANPSAA